MSNLIEEKDVTPVNLSLYLERAVIEHKLQDDHGIYVTEDGWFPFWIRVLEKRGFVGLTTYILFRNSSTHLQRLKLANKFNRRNWMGTAYLGDDNKLKIDHSLSFRDGMLTETFVRACRQYSGAIRESIPAFDPDYEMLLPLGETESEDAENE